MKKIIIFSILLILLSISGIVNRDLWNPHEFRVAEIIREISVNKDYVIPHLNNRPFIEKPPLYYISAHILSLLFNDKDGKSYRLASALWALGILFLIFKIGLIFGVDEAIISTSILATSLGFVQGSHFILVDIALLFFITLSFYGVVKYLKEEKGIYIFTLGLAGAFLTKGFLGWGIIVSALLPFIIITKRWKFIKKFIHPLNILLLFGLVSIWLIPLSLRENRRYFYKWLIYENLGRFLGSKTHHYHHTHGIFYYFYMVPLIFLPWTPLLPFIKKIKKMENKEIINFLWCWAIGGFILLSIATTKRDIYAYPLLPPFSLLLGISLNEYKLKINIKRWIRYSFQLFPLLFFIMATVLLFLKKNTIGNIEILIILGIIFTILGFILSKKIDKFPSFPYQLIILLIFLWIEILTILVPAINPYKSYKDGLNKIADFVPPNEKLIAFHPSETLRGAYPFYMGDFLKEVRTISDLKKMLKSNKIKYILVEKRYSKHILPLKLKKITQIKIGTKRRLFIFEKE